MRVWRINAKSLTKTAGMQMYLAVCRKVHHQNITFQRFKSVATLKNIHARSKMKSPHIIGLPLLTGNVQDFVLVYYMCTCHIFIKSRSLYYFCYYLAALIFVVLTH